VPLPVVPPPVVPPVVPPPVVLPVVPPPVVLPVVPPPVVLPVLLLEPVVEPTSRPDCAQATNSNNTTALRTGL
jgi:hypothetical protein